MASDAQVRTSFMALASLLQTGVGLRPDLVRSALSGAAGDAVSAAVQQGQPLTPALASALGLPEHERRLLDAAEQSGGLPSMLNGLADARQEKIKLRRRLLIGLAYPSILLVVASVLLPLPLLFSEGVGAYAKMAIPGAGAVVALLVIVLGVWPRLSDDSGLKNAPLAVLRALPFVGPRMVYGPAALCCEVLGRSIAAGIPITVTLPSALRASGHPGLARGAAQAERRIQAGGTLLEGLEQVREFPEELRRQIGLAEAAGKLDSTLLVLADDARGRYRRTLTGLVVAMVAAMLILVGVVVVVGVVTAAQTFYLDRYDQLLQDMDG